ncbi:MAG: DUF2164 domain-containing protein [Symbiobacteriia bacterium]
MVLLKIPKEEKTLLVRDFQDYLQGELDEPVGNLAAEMMLDFVLRLVAPYVYNQAIADARKVLQQQMLRADDELSYLEQPIDRRKRTTPSGEERE